MADRAEWWSELVSSIHSRVAFRMRADYRGRIEHQHTEAYQLVRWWGDEESIKRSGTDVRRHPHGAYELLAPVTGSMVIRQADSALKLEPGGLALATLDAPMDMWHSDNFSCLALVIPRARVDARIGGLLTRTVGLNAEHGMGRIVVDLLASLRSQAHTIDGLGFDAVADRAVDLLCLAYGGALLPPVYETQDNLDATIRRFVRANAVRPGHPPDLADPRHDHRDRHARHDPGRVRRGRRRVRAAARSNVPSGALRDAAVQLRVSPQPSAAVRNRGGYPGAASGSGAIRPGHHRGAGRRLRHRHDL